MVSVASRVRNTGRIAVAFTALFVASNVVPLKAEAAKLARVKTDQAEVFEGPGDQYGVITRLPKGTLIATSNATKNGFYKMKSKTGAIGWMRSGDVDHSAVQAKKRSSRAAPKAPRAERSPKRKQSRKDDFGPKIQIRALANMNMYNSAELNTLVSETPVFKNAIGLGGELGYAFGPKTSFLLRVESITKKVAGGQQGSSDVYAMTQSAMPIMGGLGLSVAKGEKASLDLAAFGGLAMSTSFTALNETQSTTYAVSTAAMTGLVKANMNVNLGANFGVFGEAGYRYLKTSLLTPEKSGTGTHVLDDANGDPRQFVIDMSGLVVGAGVALYF